MNIPDRVRFFGGYLLLGVLGLGTLALHAGHALEGTPPRASVVYGVFVPSVLALGILGGVVWLRQRNAPPGYVSRVASWCLAGGAVVAVGAGLTILYERSQGVAIADPQLVVINAAVGGAVIGFVVGVYDNQQRRARARADRLGLQLTVLNRVLRHDIRNHANVIRGNADLIALGDDDPVSRANTIKRQATDLATLGERARVFERMARLDQPGTEVVDVSATVAACCERLDRKHPAAEIEQSLPDRLRVSAHPLVDAAITNVVQNALQHNDKETPRVSVDSRTVSVDGRARVEVRVADNGPGIPETEIDVLDRGFETALEHSSGLGLWLVSWLVARSDGRLRFEENDPEGTVVALRFEPAEPVAADPEAEPPSVPLASHAGVPSAGSRSSSE